MHDRFRRSAPFDLRGGFARRPLRGKSRETFNLLKQARRFATRYEKTLRNYSAIVAIGCALLWLRI